MPERKTTVEVKITDTELMNILKFNLEASNPELVGMDIDQINILQGGPVFLTFVSIAKI